MLLMHKSRPGACMRIVVRTWHCTDATFLLLLAARAGRPRALNVRIQTDIETKVLRGHAHYTTNAAVDTHSSEAPQQCTTHDGLSRPPVSQTYCPRSPRAARTDGGQVAMDWQVQARCQLAQL